VRYYCFFITAILIARKRAPPLAETPVCCAVDFGSKFLVNDFSIQYRALRWTNTQFCYAITKIYWPSYQTSPQRVRDMRRLTSVTNSVWGTGKREQKVEICAYKEYSLKSCGFTSGRATSNSSIVRFWQKPEYTDLYNPSQSQSEMSQETSCTRAHSIKSVCSFGKKTIRRVCKCTRNTKTALRQLSNNQVAAERQFQYE